MVRLGRSCSLPALCMIAAAEPPSPPAYHASDQYLEEYGTLYDHLGMLSDHERMRAYHDAIRLNAEAHFKGKVVLDVGTGTGILAIWAAQAGARRVFAVEGTSVAQHAETMAKAHGFGGVIEVLRGRMEDVTLPEPVDVIVSEWMGYFLLRESMIHSVIYARDKWMREGGVMCAAGLFLFHHPAPPPPPPPPPPPAPARRHSPRRSCSRRTSAPACSPSP